MNECNHYNFKSNVAVFRLSDSGFTNAVPTGFSAEVRISCVDCGKEFEFLGLSAGSSPKSPTVSFDLKEARLPIQPSKD